MSYTPCRYARRRWPQLWSRLPDDRARQSLSDALANGRLGCGVGSASVA